MNVDELDRDAYDVVNELLQETPAGPERLGILEALAAVAGLRFRVGRGPSVMTHDVVITDTWTGWGRGGWSAFPATDTDAWVVAAHRTADRLNGACRELVMAGVDPAVPGEDDHDELGVEDA